MKSLKAMSVLFAATAIALLATQASHARPDARSLRQVQSVWVDSNSCTDDISDQLQQHGFFLANRPSSADAVLVVDVDRMRAYRGDSSAQYQAKLRGEDDFVIFTASGTRYGRSYGDLCDNIGDSIARSMSELG